MGCVLVRNKKFAQKLKTPLVLCLWHGKRKISPTEVYKKDGLNIVHSKDSGLWGGGIYFIVLQHTVFRFQDNQMYLKCFAQTLLLEKSMIMVLLRNQE